jgi:hypothetical protein
MHLYVEDCVREPDAEDLKNIVELDLKVHGRP